MTRTSIAADTSKRPNARSRLEGRWPAGAPASMALAFLVGFALAAIVLAVFGAGTAGTTLALQATARWSFLLFWLAYVGGAMASLWRPRFGELARRGRDLGLAFAAAQLVHVALVIWFLHIASGPVGAMLFFWAGIACTYLLAFLSWPRLGDAIGPRVWRISRTIMVEYIAVVFAADFILNPLKAGGVGNYPPTYLPFALMLVGGAALRIAAFTRSYRPTRPA